MSVSREVLGGAVNLLLHQFYGAAEFLYFALRKKQDTEHSSEEFGDVMIFSELTGQLRSYFREKTSLLLAQGQTLENIYLLFEMVLQKLESDEERNIYSAPTELFFCNRLLTESLKGFIQEISTN